jgi:putative Mg2+ transporter-C (MgtC) family protein
MVPSMEILAQIASSLPVPRLMLEARVDILLHLLAALLAGGAIGIERSLHGRPAGFRTHALVCLAASLLMLITVYQQDWFPASGDVVRIDPTRMAQGIMTGIGFLGAGVIFKEGLNVRGLTTAASIWITSAIGVLIGSGLYYPAFVGTVLTLVALGAFRWLENRLPSHQFAQSRVRFAREEVMAEDALRELLARHGFAITSLTYRLADQGTVFEYRMMIRTTDEANFTRLARSLSALPPVKEFELSPSSD